MGRRRRSKSRKREEIIQNQNSSGKNFNILSLLTNRGNMRNLSAQMREIADNMEQIGDMVDLFQQVDVLVRPKQGSGRNGNLDLWKMFRESGSMTNILQAVLPVLRQTAQGAQPAGEKRVAPISVETPREKRQPGKEEGAD